MAGPQPELFEKYIKNIPLLHTWDKGNSWNTGGFTEIELRYLYNSVSVYGTEGARIVETGAGNSTISFLCANPRLLISICPDPGIFEKIQLECSNRDIDAANLMWVPQYSEDCLPAISQQAIERRELVDIALIDGGHGWPTVFVDFCYMYGMLRQGGILIVDDIHLHSVKELARFMDEGKIYFRMAQKFAKTLVFEKTTIDTRLPDFGGSPYIVRKTKEAADTGRPYSLE